MPGDRPSSYRSDRVSSVPAEPSASVTLGDLFLASFTRLISIQPGERVLDLGARDGAAVIEVARRAGEDGEVLVLDTDTGRLELIAAAARSQGLTNLRVETSDARTLPSRDGYWDVVICHLSFAQLPEPETALKETQRVLRPVGRLGISSWGSRERCPLITLFLDAVAPFAPAARELDRVIFRYAESGKLANTLAEAGYEDATPNRLTEWPSFRDVDDYWASLTADSRFAGLVADLSPEQVAAAKQTLEAKTRFYRRRDGLEIKVEGIVLAAVK
jgi:ubiquinone/menaquinone biosynthesis C-methylase UbiE